MRGPEICGGTTRSIDKNAPKAIKSDKMIFFKAESSLNKFIDKNDRGENSWIDFVSAYAASVEDGSFLVLEASGRRGDREYSWAYVKKDIFPELVKIVNRYGLAQSNGFSSFTHGLPENFGGEVLVKYESNEQIRVSNNQAPVFSNDFGIEIYKLFSRTMKTECVQIPNADDIVEIRFLEEGRNSCQEAELKSDGAGACTFKKFSKYEGPEVYEHTESVSNDLLDEIKSIVKNNAVLLHNKLPERGFVSSFEKSLTFRFADGNEITVHDDRLLPRQMERAFFEIELKLN